MRVLLNGMQAGNRSGTGIYTMELAQRLSWSDEPEVYTVWPGECACPTQAQTDHMLLRGPFGLLRRLHYDQSGFSCDADSIQADVCHYPASVGPVHSRLPYVVTVHDLSFLHEPKWFRPERALYYRYAIRRSTQKAHRILAVSKATARDLEDKFDIPPERIDVVYNGVSSDFSPRSEEECAEARQIHDLPEHFILYVGTLEPRKNLVRLIHAFEHIADQCEHSLVLIGRYGWKYEPILRAIRSSPLTHRIIYLGHIERVFLPALMSAADVFAYPSLFEGFGLPVLEAMACGTPVLTSDRSSLSEITEGHAVCVCPEEEESIATGLQQLTEDKTLRDRLRLGGLAHAQRFTWDATAELTIASYLKV